MNRIAIASNISQLRKSGSLTQEDLARKLGVSKAAVSKWETGQGLPDITMLPKIATYFGTTIDALLGYEPQLDKAGILQEISSLREAFAEDPFEEAHSLGRSLVDEYFSCYPLLTQVASVYLNHINLAPTEECRAALAVEIYTLCRRVRENSTSASNIKQVDVVEAMLYLVDGEAQEVIRILEQGVIPEMGDSVILASAYMTTDQPEKAERTLQATLYQSIILCTNVMAQMALSHAEDGARVDELYLRLQGIIRLFGLDGIYPSASSIRLVFAQIYASNGDLDSALGCLEDYERSIREVEFPIQLKGDEFFDQLNGWLEDLVGGTDAPREGSIIQQSMLTEVTENPVFAELHESPRFKSIVADLEDRLS